MALNENAMIADFYKEFEAADARMASRLGLDTVETAQKKQERLNQAQAVARVVFRHLTEFAETVTPVHDPVMTAPEAGPRPHAHLIRVEQHKNGRII